jgi:myo-inositol-1(or 4)-monophosphatase
LVAEQSGSETRYAAIRGAGANVDGIRLRVTPNSNPASAVIGVNALPAPTHGWWQVRAMGAASLDICAVARGGLDGYIDFDGLGVWDYLAAVLVCQEAGVLVAEAENRNLFTIDPDERRRPVVANSDNILTSLSRAQRAK